MSNVSMVDGHIDRLMTNYERIKNMSVEEMAEFLCDNFECNICPAFDGNYCPNSNLKICSKAMKKHLEIEAET